MGIDFILLMGVFFAGFYFLILRPQKRKERAVKEMRESIQVGDEVTTIGGIVGKVVQVKDELVTFETGEDRVRIRVVRWAVASKGKSAADEQNSISS